MLNNLMMFSRVEIKIKMLTKKRVKPMKLSMEGAHPTILSKERTKLRMLTMQKVNPM